MLNVTIDKTNEKVNDTDIDGDRISIFRCAYSRICNAIRSCLDSEEKSAVNGMYIFLHLDFPEDRNLHIDLVRNIPSGTDTGQNSGFEERLILEDVLRELGAIDAKEIRKYRWD